MANTTPWSFSDFLVPQDTSEAPAPTILGMADSTAPVIVPVVTYWVVSAFYEAADYFDWFPTYRTYPPGEEKKRNLVSRWQTLRNVLTMHFVQIVFGFATVHLLPKAQVAPAWGNIGSAAYFGLYIKNNVPVLSDRPGLLWIAAYWSSTVWLIGRLLMAFFIFDTWAYWVHYMAHNVPWVYRNIHSVHHYNYIPYSFAAAYNHPVEGFFNDIVGFFLSALFVGLSDRESTVFYTIATIKTVDDHAGFALPYNPFHLWGWLFGNGMVYHNIHHRAWGLKANYAFYFTFWDRWNNTLYQGKRRVTEAKEKQFAKSANSSKKEV